MYVLSFLTVIFVSRDVIQEVEYVKKEAKIVYLLEVLTYLYLVISN